MDIARGFEDFFIKYKRLRSKSRLFAFILCDDRPSNRPIQKFTMDNLVWLDQLARRAKIFVFTFYSNEYRVLPTGVESSNDSLKVAGLFGIAPNQLPGIILFTVIRRGDSVSRAIYLPLNASLFEQNAEAAERILADLFSGIEKCLHSTADANSLWTSLESTIKAIRGSSRRYILIQNLQSLASLPMKFLESMVAALGEGAAKGLMGDKT